MNTNVTTSAVAQEATGVQCQRNVRGAVLRLALVARPKFSADGGTDEIVLLDLRRAPGECSVRWL